MEYVQQQYGKSRISPYIAHPNDGLPQSLFGNQVGHGSPHPVGQDTASKEARNAQASSCLEKNRSDNSFGNSIHPIPKTTPQESQSHQCDVTDSVSPNSMHVSMPTQQIVPEKRSFLKYQSTDDHQVAHQEDENRKRASTVAFPSLRQSAKTRPEETNQRLPPAKDARDRAQIRKIKQHRVLKNHVRKQIEQKGLDWKPNDMPAPPPIKRRGGKGPTVEDDEDSDESVDQDAPKPVVSSLKSREVLKEISLAASRCGLDNRRSGSQREDLKEAKYTFGRNKVKGVKVGEEMLWHLNGVKTPLKSYQLTGVSWMVQRETDDSAHKGGLLADVPGYGKTIMSLSTIVSNPPSPEEIKDGYHATLVVVPNATVLKQWQDQIQQHLEPAHTSCIRYQQSNHAITLEQLMQAKIVLITYNELQSGWPSLRFKKDLKDQYTSKSDDGKPGEFDEEQYEKILWDNTGSIHYLHWYRVIFDEVHTVKNIKSHTFLAAQHLDCKIFWGLSGTPLINAAKEIYPYLKLIKWAYGDNETEHSDNYFKNAKNRDRVDALVSLLTYRRTHEDRFLGKKMVRLPKSHSGTQWVTLTAPERKLYNLISKTLKEGPVRQNRLRQATSHFMSLEKFFRTTGGTAHLERYISELTQVESNLSAYEQIGSWDQRQVEGQEAPKNVPGFSTTELKPFGVSSFGGAFRLTTLLQLLKNTEVLQSSKCGICTKKQGEFVDPRILDCKHVFCNVCIITHFAGQYRTGEDCRCPECNAQWHGMDWTEIPRIDSIGNTIAPPRLLAAESTGPKTRRLRGKKKEEEFLEAPNRRAGDDFFGTQPVFGEDDGGLWAKIAFEDALRNGSVPVPSAKTTAVKEIVLRWIQEDPSHKGIIFTQFVTTSLIIGRMLQLEGINFVYFNSRVNGKDRKIEGFKARPDIRYLVATTRSGGQSLNITEASRVIICDPWWNRAAEEQAIGRVYRIGQMKQTHCIRILARNTVDDKIEKMQTDKDDTINRILQDDGHTTRFESEFEIMKLLEPRRWRAEVKRCIKEVCLEDGIPYEVESSEEDDSEEEDLEDERAAEEDELDTRMEDKGQGQTTSASADEQLDAELDDESMAPQHPFQNGYGDQNIGRIY